MLKAQAHVPFSQGKCAECHGTKVTGATLQAPPDLCLRCHEASRSWLAEASVHAPLKGRESCLSCHRPHTANAASLLDRSDPELCFTCHDQRKFQGKTVHGALQQGCLTCHNPHAAKQKKLVIEEVNTLCRDCHSDLRKHFHKVEGIVDPRTNRPITCVSCHLPHASEEDHLLAYEPSRELCVQCHDPSMIGPAPKK